VRCLAAILAFTTVSPSLGAQVVRGVVTERVSGEPLAGVVVSVASIPDSLRPGGIRHALTNLRGEYALSLPRAGEFSLSAKRIGVARFSEPPFHLRVGETRRVNIALERFEHRLPQVRVAETNLCIPKQDQLRTILSLWDEARTALIASEVSARDHLLSGWLSQYQRSLEPRTLRILQDQRSVAEGLYDRPMRSISGDSLAKVGYWRTQDADTMVFYGPDAEALLSDAFQSGHCFEFVQGSGTRRGFLGITFRPRRVRNMGGINGTIWIDASSFELRFVEFRYTNLITIPSNPHLGGEVHFLRHDSGAWVVRRWFIRMPQFPEIRPGIVTRGGVVRPQPYVYRVIEHGGGLFTPGLVTWEKPGRIEGTVLDSTGRAPLRGTTVSLSGTPFSVEVDSSGRFRFDSIPPGAYTLLASHRTYADLGQLVDDEPLNVLAGETYRSRMQAVTTSALISILCDGRKVEPPEATLRVLLTHSDSATALSGLPVWLRWPDPKHKAPLNPITPGIEQPLLGAQSTTDANGAVTFCGVLPDTRLELVMLRSDDDPENPYGSRVVRITTFVVLPGDLAIRAASARPPR
jgi:hypothetical protein